MKEDIKKYVPDTSVNSQMEGSLIYWQKRK